MKTKKTIHFLMTLMLALGLSVSAHAALIDMGDGTIYDTDLQLSWLQDANYAQTSGHDADGSMTWSEAMTWADNLVFAGFDDWRLPVTLQPDLSCSIQNFGLSFGYDCTGSEMGHLYYTELGNSAFPSGLSNVGDFQNIRNSTYWTGTPTLSDGLTFNFGNGGQDTGSISGVAFAWAVRSGARSVATATLSVSIQGTGSGTITSSPYAGINCGATCSAVYMVGASVTLTATPALGSVFTGWSGDADCSDGVVTMDAGKTCSATFRQSVSGTVGGLTPTKVICRNLYTRQSITIQDGQTSWDCEAAGLSVHPGESIEIIIKGTAD